MELELTTIIIATICLLIGLMAGSLLTRSLSPAEQRKRELEDKLQAKEDELKIYQRDVSDHFVKTSQLVGEMLRNQQEIGEHLATTAMRLASPEVNRQVQELTLPTGESKSHSRILSAAPQEAPKDYAPGGGILNESYGLAEGESPVETLGTAPPGKLSDNDDDDDDPTLKVS